MTAQRLRDAAARTRETAQAATQGSWASGGGYDVWETTSAHGDIVADCGLSTSDARHIALWSPPVALAVADWLDALADELGYGFIHADTLKAATAVADLVLGGAR